MRRAPIQAGRRFTVTCCVLVVLASTRQTRAAAGQWQAGGRAGVAWLDGPTWGPSAEAFLRQGITDALELDVQFTMSFHPFQPDAKMASGTGDSSSGLPWRMGIAPGLLYRWDVLRVIPYAGAGVGAFVGEGLSSRYNGLQFGVSPRAGVEYLWSRDVVLGVQASALVSLTESPMPPPGFQFTVGAGYVWGW